MDIDQRRALARIRKVRRVRRNHRRDYGRVEITPTDLSAFATIEKPDHAATDLEYAGR